MRTLIIIGVAKVNLFLRAGAIRAKKGVDPAGLGLIVCNLDFISITLEELARRIYETHSRFDRIFGKRLG